jgi:hypothetical protein
MEVSGQLNVPRHFTPKKKSIFTSGGKKTLVAQCVHWWDGPTASLEEIRSENLLLAEVVPPLQLPILQSHNQVSILTELKN